MLGSDIEDWDTPHILSEAHPFRIIVSSPALTAILAERERETETRERDRGPATVNTKHGKNLHYRHLVNANMKSKNIWSINRHLPSDLMQRFSSPKQSTVDAQLWPSQVKHFRPFLENNGKLFLTSRICCTGLSTSDAVRCQVLLSLLLNVVWIDTNIRSYYITYM